MKKTLLAICISMASVSQANVTYVDDVADIINNNCVVCHRQGGIGPMQFETYEQVRPWSPLIQIKVANREMPPYAYDKEIRYTRTAWRLEIRTRRNSSVKSYSRKY